MTGKALEMWCGTDDCGAGETVLACVYVICSTIIICQVVTLYFKNKRNR